MANDVFVPRHGGDIAAMSDYYGIPSSQWLDLSTGINPDHYPLPTISEQLFYQLPDDSHGALLSAAKAYYQVDNILAGLGSQQFIELIPRLRTACNVAVPHVGYQEHAWQWQASGHNIVMYDGFDPQSLDEKIIAGEVDCIVIINPNNPTGSLVTVDLLIGWQKKLALRGGWLVVDEAFIDVDSTQSFVTYSGLPGVFVLRSIGKFFGLAGARIGFVMACNTLLTRLSEQQSLWALSPVCQYVAVKALADFSWQQQAKERLIQTSDYLYSILQPFFQQQLLFKTAYFISVLMSQDDAEYYYQQLAKEGILTRLWIINGVDSESSNSHKQALLRFGLLSLNRQDQTQKLIKHLQVLVEKNSSEFTEELTNYDEECVIGE